MQVSGILSNGFLSLLTFVQSNVDITQTTATSEVFQFL